MATISPKQSTLTITQSGVAFASFQPPAVTGPNPNPQPVPQPADFTVNVQQGHNPHLTVNPPWLEVVGYAKLLGQPREHIGGWKFGFIQLLRIVADWASYRGVANADGSLFQELGVACSLCRDSEHASSDRSPDGEKDTPLWYFTKGLCTPMGSDRRTKVLGDSLLMLADGQRIVAAVFRDSPQRIFAYWKHNNAFTPHRLNHLHEVRTDLQFVLVFAAVDPSGALHLLQHLYWNTSWHLQIVPGPGAIATIKKTADVRLDWQGPYPGPPTHPRFRIFIDDPGLPNCNARAEQLARNPGSIKYAQTWQQWNTGH